MKFKYLILKTLKNIEPVRLINPAFFIFAPHFGLAFYRH
jgi:hypothetical protein